MFSLTELNHKLEKLRMLSVLILMMFLSLLPSSSPAPGVVLTAASLTEDTGEMLGEQLWDDVHFDFTHWPRKIVFPKKIML